MSTDPMLELVNKAKVGDLEAFERLMAQLGNEAVRTAWLMAGDACDDIVQETFITVWQELPTLRKTEAFRACFYRILQRKAWQMAAEHRKEIPLAQCPEPSRPREDNPLSEPVQQALAQLPWSQRQACVLFYFGGFSVKDIAYIQKAPVATIKSRLFQARQKLEPLLSPLIDKEVHHEKDSL